MSSSTTDSAKANGNRNAAILATMCAGVMIAFQTASKAIRDTLFLDSFEVTSLPMVVIMAAVASVAFAIPAGRLMRRLTPARMIPSGFIVSAILLVAEWLFGQTTPKVTAIAVYIHFAALGAVLISGFWSLVNERFDPHTAKTYMSRIAGGATAGGLAGGIITERLSGFLDPAQMLPVLAVFHVICALITWYITRHHRRAKGEPPEVVTPPPRELTYRPGEAPQAASEHEVSGLKIVLSVPYLRNLAYAILLTTTAAGLLDYLFKAAAAAEFLEKAERQRFFAIFYTCSSLATFLLQALFGTRVLQRFGIGVAMGSLPVVTGLGAIVNFFFPGLWTATMLRGGELAVHSSFFRAGYEQHYAPIPPNEKRAAKSVIDVIIDRTGDAVGGGLIQLGLMIAAGRDHVTLMLLTGTAIGLYVLATFVTSRVRGGYIQAVEKSLLERAVDLEAIDAHTRGRIKKPGSPNDSLHQAIPNSLAQALPFNLSRMSLQNIPVVTGDAAAGAKLGTEYDSRADQLVAIVGDLRSRDPTRVKRALKSFASVERPPYDMAIPLLAWDAVAPAVIQVLRQDVDRHAGVLLDSLLDSNEEFSIRRRVPRVLAVATSQRVADGLTDALLDKRFELRFRSAAALAILRSRAPTVHLHHERIHQALTAAIKNDTRVAMSRTAVDKLPEEDAPLLGEILEERADRGLEYVFTLLSLLLDAQHVRLAYQGIHTDDASLHGLALEYLDSVLPEDLRDPVLELVNADHQKQKKSKAARDQRQVVEDLLKSRESIAMNLVALRDELRRKGLPVPEESTDDKTGSK